MPQNVKKADEPSLETTMSDIDGIVAKMESGQLSLAESVALFEQGTRLIQTCQKTLTEAEQTITTLMKEETTHDDPN